MLSLRSHKAIELRGGGVEHSQHAVEGAVLRHEHDDVIDPAELSHLASELECTPITLKPVDRHGRA